MESFRAAERLGAGMVELDVRRTADGALVVHHDAVVPGLGPLVSLRAADLPPWLPTLEEAVAACGDMRVNVEVKSSRIDPDYDPDHAVARALAEVLSGDPGRFLVSSFDLTAVDVVRAAAPDVATAWLLAPGFDATGGAVTAAAGGHAAIHPHHSIVTEAVVTAAHDHGLAVNVWTVNDPHRMQDLAAMGVDGICTDVPDVAVALFGRAH